MHAEERERLIVEAMVGRAFVTYRALEASLTASPATIRRDLARLEEKGRITRVRGGAKLVAQERDSVSPAMPRVALTGTPFDQAIGQRFEQKRAMGGRLRISVDRARAS